MSAQYLLCGNFHVADAFLPVHSQWDGNNHPFPLSGSGDTDYDIAVQYGEKSLLDWPSYQQTPKELYYRGMNMEQIHHCLREIAKLPDVVPLLCAKYCGYTDQKELYDLLTSPKFHYDMRLVEDLSKITEDVTKVSMIEVGGRGTTFCYDTLKPNLTEEMTLVISGESCLDTGLKGVTKGTAVQALQKMWGITPEETLVFGDQFNDVEMFDCAYYSYAMENAVDGVKQRARFLAGNNNEGAVVNVIRALTGL